MLTITQLNCFVTVAQTANFSKAASILCITPTAVSKQIKGLEAQIDEQLFQRTTRQVHLTEFGELLYEQCIELLNQVQSIEQFIVAKKAQPQGKLNVLVSTILAKPFVLKHIAGFMKQFPLIECELLFSEHDSDVGRQEIDIMVGFPLIPPHTDNLKYRNMYRVENLLCAAPSLISKTGLPKTPEDLMTLPFISHSLRKPATKLPLADGCSLLCPAPILFMDNFDALNKACIDGIGAFLSGDRLIKEALENGVLLQLLPEIQFQSYEIYMFYQAYDYEQPKIRAFLDYFCDKL